MTPEVSVVIPCFERPEKLRRAIASVRSQTFADIEVIVVDDASPTDHTPVVESFGDDRLHCVRHDRNLGAGAARATGAGNARGWVVAFLDSDDWWLPHHLAVAVSELAAGEEDAVTTWFEMHYPSGRVSTRCPRQHRSLIARTVRGVDLSPGSTLVLRREALERTGYWRDDMRREEDYEWLLRYGLGGGELRIIPTVTVGIEADDRPLDIAALARDQATTLAAHTHSLEALDPRLARALRAKFAEELAWAHWRNGERTRMAAPLLRAVAGDPRYRSQKLTASVTHRAAFALDRRVRRSRL